MLTYVTPTENIDVGFYKSKYVEIEQDVYGEATLTRIIQNGHPNVAGIKISPTTDSRVVRVVNNTMNMVQLRVRKPFAVFEMPDPPMEDEELVATFHASDAMRDDPISTLNLSKHLTDLLVDGGYTNISRVHDASDEELLAIDGLGAVSLANIKWAVRLYYEQT